jgi:hypothetical protein
MACGRERRYWKLTKSAIAGQIPAVPEFGHIAFAADVGLRILLRNRNWDQITTDISG